MKKIITFFCCVLTVFCFPVVCGADAVPDTSAESFVLYCVNNGQIIAAKDENKRMKPASTTKLMTTLITLERAAKGNQAVTFTQEMAAEGSSMYLKFGEKVTLKDLAVGMMMSSGNDAANAAALSIGGSLEKFAEMMNRRAGEIGMENTHFITPSGLDDEQHYSTAYDLALLMAEGLRNEDFSNLTSLKSASVDFIEPDNKHVTYSNHNRLLSMYEYCVGGKTGYTMAAGRCLVSAAQKDGLTLVCVTLNDRNDWNDHCDLYQYGFEKLTCYRSPDSDFCVELPCAGGEKDSVAVIGENDASLVVNAESADKIERKIYTDSFLYAPVRQGDAVGSIEYMLNGESVGSVRLVAAEDIEIKTAPKGFIQKIKDLFHNG